MNNTFTEPMLYVSSREILNWYHKLMATIKLNCMKIDDHDCLSSASILYNFKTINL